METRDLVHSWRRGRASVDPDGGMRVAPREPPSLAGKLRAAYAWLTERAVISPHLDMEFGAPLVVGAGGGRVELRPEGWSSYALMPLLTLATSQRLLFVGPPGRGKTTMATLVALLSGCSPALVQRSIQRGHPQLTIADLLGGPLPAELLRAEDAGQIRVAWRGWLRLRVKIIDEYNRIPTKTQSALLSLMADGQAEMFEQVLDAGKAAWFLTANDELGGGTFPVIEALRDRIDAVVRCAPFDGRHVAELSSRIAEARSPEHHVPDDIVFSGDELARLEADIRATPVPPSVEDFLGFFAGLMEFCLRASDRLEARNKDTLHLAGRRVAQVCTEDCPLDKQSHLCSQSENGLSTRALQATLLYAKALAYFRGQPAVHLDDVRQVAPFTLFDRLRQNQQGAFFQRSEGQVFLIDQGGWLRQLVDKASAQHALFAPQRELVARLLRDADGAGALSVAELRRRSEEVVQAMQRLLQRSEMSAPVHDDLVALKALHARYETLLSRRRGGP